MSRQKGCWSRRALTHNLKRLLLKLILPMSSFVPKITTLSRRPLVRKPHTECVGAEHHFRPSHRGLVQASSQSGVHLFQPLKNSQATVSTAGLRQERPPLAAGQIHRSCLTCVSAHFY